MLTKVVFLFFWSRSDSTKKLAACNHATLAHYILTPALYSDACAIYSDAYSITTIVVATVVHNPARCSLRARKFCRFCGDGRLQQDITLVIYAWRPECTSADGQIIWWNGIVPAIPVITRRSYIDALAPTRYFLSFRASNSFSSRLCL